ncbi:MAG: PEP-CTERM sorting domain-containing protein [Pirellulales bacterium]
MSNDETRNRARGAHSCIAILAIGCTVAFAGSDSTHAAGTILSTGFEPPMVTGQLQGQQGWAVAGGGTSTAIVENSVVHSGTQALQVTKTAAPNNDRRWAVPQNGYPTERFVVVDWDMRVAPSLSAAFGPFFGMEGYDADLSPYVLGSLGVDAATGNVLYQEQGTGTLLEGPIVSFNQWHHFRLVFDFLTDTYRGFVNGTQVANTGFVDGAFHLDNFTDADISTFAAAGDPVSQSAGSTAWFDNLVVRDAAYGDYDIDGDIDAADFTRWRQTFGTAVTPAGNGADGNRNGVVDAADYVIWRNAVGAGPAAGAGLAGLVVPEPAVVSLLFAAASIAVFVRRRECA